MQVDFDGLLGVNDVAAQLGVATATVKKMVKRGDISPVRIIGGALIIPTETLVGVKVKKIGRPKIRRRRKKVAK